MQKTLLPLIALIGAAMLPAACGNASQTDETPVEGAIQVEDDGIVVLNPTVTLPPAGRDVTAAYFSITSSLESDARIIAASSVDAESAELHTHTMQDGMMAMRRVDGVDLPAGENVMFERGGLHVMLFGVSPSLVSGDMLTIDLTIETDDGEETVSFQAPVVAMG